jgi:hypothetical protein
MATLASVNVPLGSVRVWAVFILCLLFSALGVGLSFLVLGTTITGYRLWGIGLVISVTMLGITYGAKYANADARESFTPVDLIQYLSQGFLWPSTWPALASVAGIQKIEAPQAGALLYDFVRQALAA